MRLGDLLRVRDRLDAVAARIREDGVSVEGSTGQRTCNPLLARPLPRRYPTLAGFE